MKKIEVELKSEWQETQVELLKSLHGYEVEKVNENAGIVDYVAENGDEGKKLLRVIVDPKLNASKAYMETVTKTLEDVEDGPYDEATIIAESFTSASKRLVRKKEDLEYVSHKSEPRYSIIDLLDVIQSQTRELCEAKCGKFPKNEEDCKGYQDGEYTCPLRRVSDDADFHAERRWLKLLMKDFSRLVTLKEGMKK